jgi:hypothetical protein
MANDALTRAGSRWVRVSAPMKHSTSWCFVNRYAGLTAWFWPHC